jgi:hypothetical protein
LFISKGYSVGDSELSWLEVSGFLGSSESLDALLMLVESLSGSLGGVLPSEISWLVLLLGVEFLGFISLLFVDDGQALGDGLSGNL